MNKKDTNLISLRDESLFKYRNKSFIFHIKQNLLKFLIKKKDEVTPSEIDAIDVALLSIDELVTHYLDRETVRNNKHHISNSQLELLGIKIKQLEAKLDEVRNLKEKIQYDENIPSYLVTRELTKMIREIYFYEEELRKTKEELFLLNANSVLKTGTLQLNGSYKEDPAIASTLVKQVYDLLKNISSRPLSIQVIEQAVTETITLSSLFGDD